MTAATCSAPDCGQTLTKAAKDGRCINCWAQALTAAQVAQHDGTTAQRQRIAELGPLPELLKANREARRP